MQDIYYFKFYGKEQRRDKEKRRKKKNERECKVEMIFQEACTNTHSHFFDLKQCLSARTLCKFALYMFTNIQQ